MSIVNRYLKWLQKDAPAAEVEKYPEIDSNGETSVKGIYIIGDLTGIPLLKLAAESGKRIIDHLLADEEFIKSRSVNKADDILDLIIIGAGPAGVAAGMEAAKNKLRFQILESAQKFNTIINFPKGKPIYAEPEEFEQTSNLKIGNGTKESLIQGLYEQIGDKDLPIEEGIAAERIEKSGGHFNVISGENIHRALRVIIAVGKSGNSRMLNVEGEGLPKVYNRLFDPKDAAGEDVMVVGGGDSALEAAIACAEYADSVSLSYRKSEFSRPKEGNSEKFDDLVKAGKIKLYLRTEVKEIKADSVLLADENQNIEEIPNSMMFVLIGKEIPVAFLKRSGIRMEGELSSISKLQFLLLILISGVIYFGKSSAEFYHHFLGDSGKLESWWELAGRILTIDFWGKYFTLPGVLTASLFSESVRIWNVTKYINASIAYIAFTGAVFLGVYLLTDFTRNNYRKLRPDWKTFKYAYFISVGVFFVIIFFGSRYFGLDLFGKSQSFWYTALYSLTIFIFGLRRIHVKPTKYIKLQTWSLILIQVFPLFILPEILLPWLSGIGALGDDNGFILSQIFPNGSFWRAYGFILAWPLNFGNLYNGNITVFWLVFSIIQTFIFIPYIVYRWGKGAYCGWICSCGALAETLGDEYRTLAPHGERAKKWENFGQFALLAAVIITGAKLLGIVFNFNIPIINESVSYTADFFQKFYYIGIDVIFAGVLGVGVYFFLSGRIWCRFGCPLAALMHIYNRFSRYRIFSDKKKCISCNICTKVCHMGIDVMNYANKGIPMNDVECVRCSACVVNCPTQVLTFGSLPKGDIDNQYHNRNQLPLLPHSDWRSGL